MSFVPLHWILGMLVVNCSIREREAISFYVSRNKLPVFCIWRPNFRTSVHSSWEYGVKPKAFRLKIWV